MKKKLVIALVVLCGLGLVGWGGYYAYGEYQQKQIWEEATRPFNTLTKIREAMNPIMGQPTDFNKKTMVVFFNSECDHCKAEADVLSKHFEQLLDIQLWFITFEEAGQARSFLRRKRLTGHPDFHLFITTPEEAKALFGGLWMPQTLLYEDNQLERGFLGPVKFDEQIEPFLD